MAKEIAVLAGGCFWCTEAIYLDVAGVETVTSGYTGGQAIDPTYREVCGGGTGHAEAVRIAFDNDVISYGDLLDIFFATHDPTQLNRQGGDVGTQYRSAIFPQDEGQRAAAEAGIARANDERGGKVVTTIEPAQTGIRPRIIIRIISRAKGRATPSARRWSRRNSTSSGRVSRRS